ncbi:mannitol-1-phosphate 5-dehydrogenase [Orbus mooreae]|uniref:mannitol-1-phosphate 5-dehydrogenase n=1 Tax=Orbus mooreae TaxID=3074107 RepID=UPI00370D3C53
MNVVHFGAGNIGRGLIGYILSLNNCNICFFDVNNSAVDQLNNDKSYSIEILNDPTNIVTIKNISALACGNISDELINKFLDADLVTTSVGINNLSKIAPVLLQLINERVKARKSIDIIANENAINASSLLADEIKKLTAESEFTQLNKYCSFVNSAIDRQSLTAQHNGKPITAVEPFFEWVINNSELLNKDLLNLQSVKFVPELKPYIEKKLYIVNLGHCAAAYLGQFVGKSTILDTLMIPSFKAFIRETMKQSATYLTKQYSFSNDELLDYIDNTLARFSNPHLVDAVTRVGGSPIRKLGNNERIIGPLQQLYRHNLPYQHLVVIAALALCFDVKEDEQSQKIQSMIRENKIEDIIRQLTGLTEDTLVNDIAQKYLDLKNLVASNQQLNGNLTDAITSFLNIEG